MGRAYHYYKSCVDHAPHEVEALDGMIEKAKNITLDTMRKHCEGFAEIAQSLGYERDSRKGLTIRNDYHVSYHRSEYLGVRCYFMCWSAIEYIWRREE